MANKSGEAHAINGGHDRATTPKGVPLFSPIVAVFTETFKEPSVAVPRIAILINQVMNVER